jgi:hypothetical protein
MISYHRRRFGVRPDPIEATPDHDGIRLTDEVRILPSSFRKERSNGAGSREWALKRGSSSVRIRCNKPGALVNQLDGLCDILERIGAALS